MGGRVAATVPTQRHARFDHAHAATVGADRGRGVPRLHEGPHRDAGKPAGDRARLSAGGPTHRRRSTPPPTTARVARAESRHARLESPLHRRRRRDRLPRGPLRRRDPAPGVDQRPRRQDRRADRRPVQRPGHQPVVLAGAAEARLRGPGDLLEPPGHRRLRAARGPGPGRDRGLRRGRAVGDGPLRRRPRGPDGLVDGRQHHVRAGGRPSRAGHGPVRRRRRPGRHVLDDARPAARPAGPRPRLHGQPLPRS